MAYFKMSYLPKDPISKYSHSVLALGPQNMNFEGTQFNP